MTSRPNTTRLGLETLEARDTPASPGVGTVLQTGDFIAFETRLGRYFSSQASIGAVSAVPLANLDPQASDAVFTIQEVGGDGIIQSGDRIAIRTRQGYYLNSHASVGAVSAVPHANLDPQVSDEVFTIIKRSGASPDPAITSTDQVMLATRTGFYFNSWGSQGGVQAVRQANFDTGVSDEIFTLLVIPPNLAIPRDLPGPTNVPFNEPAPYKTKEPGDAGDRVATAHRLGAYLGHFERTVEITGQIAKQGTDADLYEVYLQNGQTVTFDVDTTGALDTALRVMDKSGSPLARNHARVSEDPDERTKPQGKDPFIRFTAPKAGVYVVAVMAQRNDLFNGKTGQAVYKPDPRRPDPGVTGEYKLVVGAGDIIGVSGQVVGGNKVKLVYQTTGTNLGAPLPIGIFRSASPVYSLSTAELIFHTQVSGYDKDGWRGAHEVTVSLAGAPKTDPAKPYLFAILDPTPSQLNRGLIDPLTPGLWGRIVETNQDNNVIAIRL